MTFNPSTAQPDETLYNSIPKLSHNYVFVPSSIALNFSLTLGMGQANNTLVNNLGINLVDRMRVVYGGEVIQDLNRYDLYSTYRDLFLLKRERENMLREGVSSLNMRKLRTSAGDKVTSDANEVALGMIYGSKYRIPISHPILDQHGTFYAKQLNNTLTFELTLAQSSSIAITSDNTKSYAYSISNIELEYETIQSDYLA